MAAFNVNLIDAKASYSFSPENLGTFNTRLNATVYGEYVFTDQSGANVDVLGKQNARTNIAPPMPKTKLAFTTNWFRDNHSASVAVNWFSAVTHDAQVVDLYPHDGIFQPPEEIEEDPLVDVRYAYLFDDYFNSQFTVSVGVNNLFDYKPTLTGQIGGFESRLINNWYRQYYVSVDWVPGG